MRRREVADLALELLAAVLVGGVLGVALVLVAISIWVDQ